MEVKGISHSSKEPYAVMVMDLTISLMASLFAILFIRWLSDPIPSFTAVVLRWEALSLISSLAGFLIVGSHKISLIYSTIRTTGKLAVAVLIKELLMVAFIFTGVALIGSIKAKVLLILLDCIICLTLMILIRAIAVTFIERNRNTIEFNVSRMSILIYGISDKSTAILQRLFSSAHYNPIAFVTTDMAYNGHIIHDRKVFACSNQEEFQKICASLGGIEGIIFATRADEEEQKDKIMQWCSNIGIGVFISPQVEIVRPYRETSTLQVGNSEDMFSNACEPGFIPDGMSGFERNTKRAFDFFIALILIIIFSPLFLICYIAIKLEDNGPAIYKQERIGRFGRPFYILKFRSMKVDAENAGPALYSGDDDPRLTKVGKFLRQHHLDEIPQLFNVLHGDMAFIGYRPERQFYIDQIIKKDPRYVYLYQIRPGVTSYATLKNGYADTMEKMLKRLQFDLYYLKNRSWAFDIKILFQTFINIVSGKKF